jgi:hypothetical protein
MSGRIRSIFSATGPKDAFDHLTQSFFVLDDQDASPVGLRW